MTAGRSVTLLWDRFAAGGDPEAGKIVPLGEALTRAYSCDVHVQAAIADGRRVRHSDIGQIPIRLECLMLDPDAPGHAPSPEWRQALRERIDRLLEVHPGAFAYETRGGARIVYALDQPFEIASLADAERWRASYLAVCSRFREEFGIECDEACSDFTRLFRAPHATRDQAAGPEHLPRLGDPHAIGVIELPAVPSPERKNTASHAPLGSVPPGALGADDDAACAAVALARTCILGRLLAASGHVLGVRQLASGPAVRIRCLNADAHARGGASGSADESAILLPRSGRGSISCMRTACRGIEGDEWLCYFTDDELEAAGVRVLRVRDVYPHNTDCAGRTRIGVRLVGRDLSEHYFRASEGTEAHRALLTACNAVSAKAIRIGSWIGATFNAEGGIDRVYGIADPRVQKGAA